MITKIAFLPRILPGVFRLAPAATAAGYSMPHESFFFYGISVSALLHVAVLYGFPKPPPVERPIAALEPTLCALAFSVPAEEPPPPPEPEPGAKAKTEETDSSEASEEYAHLPTPIVDITPGAITIPGRLEPGKIPDKDTFHWAPPKNPGVGSGKTGGGIIVPLDDLDKKPAATNRVAPRYPTEAKRLGYTGTVLMRFIVDHRGNVADVEIVKSDHPEFEKAAVEAMLRWRFNPGMKNNRRVSTRMEMPMVFSLSNEA